VLPNKARPAECPEFVGARGGYYNSHDPLVRIDYITIELIESTLARLSSISIEDSESQQLWGRSVRVKGAVQHGIVNTVCPTRSRGALLYLPSRLLQLVMTGLWP
jgi:hypothetical protein